MLRARRRLLRGAAARERGRRHGGDQEGDRRRRGDGRRGAGPGGRDRDGDGAEHAARGGHRDARRREGPAHGGARGLARRDAAGRAEPVLPARLRRHVVDAGRRQRRVRVRAPRASHAALRARGRGAEASAGGDAAVGEERVAAALDVRGGGAGEAAEVWEGWAVEAEGECVA